MNKVLSILIIFYFLISCDEINKVINPSDEYLIEKSIQPKTEEQKISSGNDIEIVIPGNSLNGNLELKVNKESSVPEFKIDNFKLGSNNFKIKFKGNIDFNSSVEIRINYNPSLIKSGQTASQSVKPFYYQNGTWKMLTNFQIDESNQKIVIKVRSLQNPVVSKFNDKLQDGEGEIIIGDGYSTTDSGQGDSPFSKFELLYVGIVVGINWDDGSSEQINSWIFDYSEDTKSKIVWNGNKFSTRVEKIVPKDWITEYTAKPDSLIQIVSGELVKETDNATLVKLNFDEYSVKRTYYGPERDPDEYIVTKSFIIENLKISYPDPKYFPDSYPFQDIFGTEVGKYVKNLKCKSYSRSWNMSNGGFEISERNLTSFIFSNEYGSLNIDFYKRIK